MSFPRTSAFGQELGFQRIAQASRLGGPIVRTPEDNQRRSDARREEAQKVIDNTVTIEKSVLEVWVAGLRGAAELAMDGRKSSWQGPAPGDAIDQIADEIDRYLDR